MALSSCTELTLSGTGLRAVYKDVVVVDSGNGNVGGKNTSKFLSCDLCSPLNAWIRFHRHRTGSDPMKSYSINFMLRYFLKLFNWLQILASNQM